MKQSTIFKPWQRLDLKQHISQNIIVALKILQSNNIELEQKINEELLENPLLELYNDDTQKLNNNLDDHIDSESETSNISESNSFDISPEDLDRYYDDGTDTGYSQYNSTNDAGTVIEEVTKYEKTIQDHLAEQITFISLTLEEKEIAYIIISSIDNHGYLILSPEDIAEFNKVPLKTVNYVLDIIQSLDPPGIAAKNHQECLLLQLERKELKNSTAYKIIQYCYKEYIEKKFNIILEQLQLTNQDFAEADKIIKKLYIYPTQSFGQVDENNYIVPDVIFFKNDNEWHIIINEEYSSKLKINKKLLNDYKINKDAKLKYYIKTKLNSAKFLIKSIHQRNSTIFNVCSMILNLQKKYFETGDINYLNVMSLNDIAKLTGLNDSTISRTIANKYAETPFGIIKLRNMFSTGLKNTNTGNDLSRNSIIDKIKIIIDEENKKNPLSDIEISNILKNKGIKIERRTVAKYRTEAGILPRHHRKNF